MTTAGRRAPHPFLYFLLFLPFGATSGFVSVTVAYMAGRAHISDGTIAALVAMSTLPHTWKFLWAPAVDTLWTGRGWYVTSNLVSSAAIVAMGLIPITQANVGLLSAVIFINGLATTFIGMCTEVLMAQLTPPEQRGAAAGWSQAGNVGGTTVGGLGLLIAEHTHATWLPAVVVGALLLLCSVVLLGIQAPPRPATRERFTDSLRHLGKNVWGTIGSRVGILAMLICFLPIGSGGASALFAVMAPEWRASAELVSFSNGLISGGASIVGCLIGGKLADRLDKRTAYALSGVLLALVAFAMAAGPRTPLAYAAGVIAYNLAIGLCYATFTAFVLDIIGTSGAATKYNIFASLANMPIYAMTRLDGVVAEGHGRTAMLWVDGGAGIAGAVLLMILVLALGRRPAAAT